MSRRLFLAALLLAAPLVAQPPQRLVSALPACTEITDWAAYWVVDAQDSQDCTGGGGSTRAYCRCVQNGSWQWVPVMLRGPQGDTGATGAAGAAGATGAAGAAGPAGADGADGTDGATGATGATGEAGPAGPQGSAGAQGAQGAEGAQGAQGIQGIQGPQGATGAQGLQGETGAQGPAGAQGVQGAQGEQGLQGPQGNTGAQGPPGDPLSACAAWPVGSIFISTSATNPGTSLGCGTWSAFAAGRVLVGIDAGQVEFDTAEETGGAKTHALTVAELPAHTHVVTSQTATTGSATSYEHGTLDASSAEAEATEVTGSTGSGTAHSHLPPYIVLHMWKRTA